MAVSVVYYSRSQVPRWAYRVACDLPRRYVKRPGMPNVEGSLFCANRCQSAGCYNCWMPTHPERESAWLAYVEEVLAAHLLACAEATLAEENTVDLETEDGIPLSDDLLAPVIKA